MLCGYKQQFLIFTDTSGNYYSSMHICSAPDAIEAFLHFSINCKFDPCADKIWHSCTAFLRQPPPSPPSLHRLNRRKPGLLEEGVLPTLRDAKARLLQPGFASIPCSAEVWAFCCESAELERMSRLSASATDGCFRSPCSERWMRCPGAAAPASMHARPPRWGGVRFRPLSPSVRVFEFDFADLPGPSGRKRGVRFPIDTAGTVHAVVCWWRCFMDEGRTVVMSTSPEAGEGSPGPRRDHWRQSVYLLSDPVVVVEADDAVRAVACHDDSAIWFSAVERQRGLPPPGKDVAGSMSGFPEQGAAGVKLLATAAAGATGEGAAGEARSPAIDSSAGGVETPRGAILPKCVSNRAGIPQEGPESAFPPVCLCGLHRTCPPSRIWMLNDEERTTAFRLVIGAVLSNHGGGEAERQGGRGTKNNGVTDDDASTGTVVCACVSHGFLLPLLAAQEGASVVLEIPPSATAAAVCRDVYRANGIDDSKVQPFSGGGGGGGRGGGGLANFYDILSPPPGSADALARVGKLDAVVGEPYFADLSSAWPFESLLLFWCVRTALEAGGCFSPRTRVVPARARLLACPFACDLLFRGRRRVATVGGIDMSAVNGGLGCTGVSRRGSDGGVAGGEDEQEESKKWQRGAVASVKLQEYHHVLLGPPTAVLDMDLTSPLCDLLGGSVEMVCRFPEGASSRGKTNPVMCHGVALWLDIWLDEKGHHRLSTGPEASYWPQGLLFFEEGWSVIPCGRSFHLEASLEDGALTVDIS